MKKGFYYPQLDSLRGISFLAIFLYHAGRSTRGGTLIPDFLAFVQSYLYLGLDVFFILSSFLLTLLGLTEWRSNRSFSFKRYFGRRVLRIWPLYYLIMIFAFIALPLAAKWLNIHISIPPPAWYLFFVSNFYQVDHVYFLRILWTLSVEEQFYLLLGICLMLFHKRLNIVFTCFIILSVGFTLYASVNSISTYTHTFTYFFDFALGGLAAVALFNKTPVTRYLASFTGWKGTVFYLYVPIHFIIFYVLDSTVSAEWREGLDILNRYLIILYVSLFIIIQIMHDNNTGFWKKNKILRFTGKISYGLYCFHGIVLTFTPIFFPVIEKITPGIRILIILGITYVIAFLSFRYFESPFLRLKSKIRN